MPGYIFLFSDHSCFPTTYVQGCTPMDGAMGLQGYSFVIGVTCSFLVLPDLHPGLHPPADGSVGSRDDPVTQFQQMYADVFAEFSVLIS